MKSSVSERMRRFYDGYWYLLFISVMILLAHTTVFVGGRMLFGGYQEFIFGGLMLISMAVGCFVCRDARFLIMPFMSFILLITPEHCPNVPYYSDFYGQPLQRILIGALAAMLAVSFLFFVIRNRRVANQIRWGGPAFFGMAIFCFTLLFNGLGSQWYSLSNLYFALAMTAALLVVYLLFTAYVSFDHTAVDYFMAAVMATSLVICAQLLLAYLKRDVQIVDGTVVKESVVLGWGIWTAIGGMIAFLMPATFSFAHSHRHGWLFYLVGCFEYACILLTQSRGALLFGTLSLLLCLGVLFFRGRNRRCNRVLTCLLLIGGVAGVILLWDSLSGLVQNYLDYGFSDNGRYEKWRYGWNHFLTHPILGAGFYNDFFYEGWPKSVFPYWYHNTWIQFLGSCGMLGFLGYLFHRFTTLVLVFRRGNSCKTFLGICLFGLMTFSLLDVLFFNTYATMIYSLMLLFIERSTVLAEVKKTPRRPKRARGSWKRSLKLK